ncbi:MAG: hypothetical protein ACHQ50_07025 [Fimbriimonadales bacterium]
MLYRILGFAIGFGTILAVSILVGHWRSAPPRVLSENQGRIRTVEIQYTKDAATRTWPCLKAFLAQLDPSVEVIAVCGDEADAGAFRSASKSLPPHETEVVVMKSPITGWSKDRFLVASKGRTYLLCPKASPSALPARSNDALIAGALAKRWPDRFRTVETGLVFDSGDILVSGLRVLVDDEIPTKNPGLGDWLRNVKSMAGREPLWLKGAPAHHVGMFAAPLDSSTVVVGDPDLGKTLWTPAASRKLGAPDFSLSATEPFRRAISELRAAGYHVVRTPLVVMDPRVYVTYTNAVFEVRDGKRIVYMPSYGDAELDEAATEAYRSQGWEVHPIPVASVFRLCGTIGCLVNVLERD